MRQGAGCWAQTSRAGVPQGAPPQSHPAPGWPRHAAGQPGSGLAAAAVLAAGSSAFGGYFQVLERSRGVMRLSPRRPKNRAQLRARGAAGRGEGREGVSASPGAGQAGTPRPSAPRGLPRVGTQQLETERGHESSRVLNFNGNP